MTYFAAHHEPASIRDILVAVKAAINTAYGPDATGGCFRDVRLVKKNAVDALNGLEGAIDFPACLVEYPGGEYEKGGGGWGVRHSPAIHIYVAASNLVSNEDALLGQAAPAGFDDWGIVDMLDLLRKLLAGQKLGLDLETGLIPFDEEFIGRNVDEDNRTEWNLYVQKYECKRNVDWIPTVARGTGIDTTHKNAGGDAIAEDQHDT